MEPAQQDVLVEDVVETASTTTPSSPTTPVKSVRFSDDSKRGDIGEALSGNSSTSTSTASFTLPDYLLDVTDKDEQVRILLQKVAGLEEQLHVMSIRVKQLEQAKGLIEKQLQRDDSTNGEDDKPDIPSIVVVTGLPNDQSNGSDKNGSVNEGDNTSDNSNNSNNSNDGSSKQEGQYLSENHRRFVEQLKEEEANGGSAMNTAQLRGKGLAKKTSSKDIKALARTVSSGVEKQKVTKETLKRREYISKEILDTENNYVQALDVTIKLFLNPLTESLLLPPEDIQLIFCRIDVIAMNHQKFLSALNERVSNWHADQQIGDLFFKETDFLVRYTQYVNNFNTALATLNEAKSSNPALAKFIEKCEKAPECNFNDLHSFLIQPIQRIPRYEMLIRDLLRHTHHNHPDYDNLNRALVKIEGVTKYINEQKKNAQDIAIIETKIGDKSAKALNLPMRTFVTEGDVLVVNNKSFLRNQSTSPVHLYLFSNLLVICTEEKRKGSEQVHKLKDKLKLDESTVINVLDTQVAGSLGLVHGFEVESEMKRRRIAFGTATEAETTSWVQHFNDLLDSYVARQRTRTMTGTISEMPKQN